MRVPVPDGPITRELIDEVARRFHAEHRALYGYDFDGDDSQQVEWVNLRVAGIGEIRRPELVAHDIPADVPAPEPATHRTVCFDAGQGYVDTPIYWRPDLCPGQVLHGPAIVEEFGATVPLHPGFTARVDAYLNIIVTRKEQE